MKQEKVNTIELLNYHKLEELNKMPTSHVFISYQDKWLSFFRYFIRPMLREGEIFMNDLHEFIPKHEYIRSAELITNTELNKPHFTVLVEYIT